MIYQDQWKALATRIRGLMQAAHLDARYLAVRSSDTYGRAKYLRSHAEGILAALKDFQRDFQQALPPTAIQSIRAFVKQNGNLINDTSPARDAYQERVWTTVVGLGALETEISFLLSDPQEFIRARSELAFSHLQRLIVVDRDVRPPVASSRSAAPSASTWTRRTGDAAARAGQASRMR
jgi:hypothetical protein